MVLLADLLRPVPALELLPAASPLSPELERQLSLVKQSLAKGNHQEAQQCAESYLDACADSGDSWSEAVMLLALAEVHTSWGDFEGARDHAKQARVIFQSSGGSREEACAAAAASRAEFSIYSSLLRDRAAGAEAEGSSYQAVNDVIVEVQKLLQAFGESHSADERLQVAAEAAALLLGAEGSLALGESSLASTAVKNALRCYRSLGDVRSQAAALRALALASLKGRRSEEAVQSSSLAAAKSREIRDVPGEATAMRLAAEAQLAAGDLQKAARSAEDSAALFKAAAHTRQEAEALLCAATAYHTRATRRQATAQRSSLMGWAEQSHALAEKALALHRHSSSTGGLPSSRGEAEALLTRAFASLARCRHGAEDAAPAAGAEAWKDAEEAQKLFTDLSDRKGAAGAILAQVQVLCLDEDRYDEAMVLLKEATDLFKRCGDQEGVDSAAQLFATLQGATLGDQQAADGAKAANPMMYSDATCATLGGLAAVGLSKAWTDHIHFKFSGVIARPVANTVKSKK